MSSEVNKNETSRESGEDISDIYSGGFYEYQDSKIRERHGHVPKWLWFITLGLIIWGVYYLAIYWNAPHPILY